MRAGLRLLEEQDEYRQAELEALCVKIREGIEQAERGELVDGEEAVSRVKARATSKRRRAGK